MPMTGKTTTKSYGRQIQWDNNKDNTLAVRRNKTIAKELRQINIIKQLLKRCAYCQAKQIRDPKSK